MKRREFVAGALALPFLGGCRGLFCGRATAPRRISPNAKVNVGVIGCGVIAKGRLGRSQVERPE